MVHELYQEKYDKIKWVIQTRQEHERILSQGPAGLFMAEDYDSAQPGAQAREIARQRLYIAALGVPLYALEEIRNSLAGSDLTPSYSN